MEDYSGPGAVQQMVVMQHLCMPTAIKLNRRRRRTRARLDVRVHKLLWRARSCFFLLLLTWLIFKKPSNQVMFLCDSKQTTSHGFIYVIGILECFLSDGCYLFVYLWRCTGNIYKVLRSEIGDTERPRLRSISWLCHQMFYPYVKMSATQARDIDNLRHSRSPFSFCLSLFFFRSAKNLGICESAKDGRDASYKNREKKATFVGCIWRSLQIGSAFMWRCDVIGIQMRPPKHADPEMGHNLCDILSFLL